MKRLMMIAAAVVGTAFVVHGDEWTDPDTVPRLGLGTWMIYSRWYSDSPLMWQASTYDGYLKDKDEKIVGTIQVKVGKLNQTTKLADVQATVTGLDGKKKTLKAPIMGKEMFFDDIPATVRLVGGDSCEVTLRRQGMSGKYGSYDIDGSRNMFASKYDKAVATAALDACQGAVNMAWKGKDGWNGLSVTIAVKGKARVAGTLADGTRVTANGQLVVGEEWCCVPVLAPKANLAFVLWLPMNGRAARSTGANGQAARSLMVVGLGEGVKVGKPGTLKGGAKFQVDAAAFSAMWGQAVLPYLPAGVAITEADGRWTLPKEGKVVYEKGTATVDPTKTGENPSALKLTYKAKDGTFKGSFKAYADANGKPKATTVNVAGVMIDGVGYGAATVKNAGGVSVTIGIE